MSDDFMLDTDELQRRMDGAIASLRTEFASLRTGRGSSSMLDPIVVEAYGQRTPINQVGTVNVPEPRMVTINVWDKSMVGAVEKAIRESGLGINPQLNGTIIMLPIPELNEERRRELSKVAGHYAESTRVSVRNMKFPCCTVNKDEVFNFIQNALIKFVRNAPSLRWLRSDLSIENIAMLQEERSRLGKGEIELLSNHTIINLSD